MYISDVYIIYTVITYHIYTNCIFSILYIYSLFTNVYKIPLSGNYAMARQPICKCPEVREVRSDHLVFWVEKNPPIVSLYISDAPQWDWIIYLHER